MFYYSIIPSAVMYDKKLSDGAKILYAIILSLANNKGLCDATNKYLSDLTSKSERTITYQIKELLDNDYIKVDYKQFKQRVIYPVWKIKTSTIKKATKLYQKFVDEEHLNNQMMTLDEIYRKI
jgi:DNA-binding transcriptional ArsR family regulator